MTNTKAKLEFVWAMARYTSATVRQCEELMRYAGTLWRLERYHSLASIAKRERLRGRVTELCWEITEPRAHQVCTNALAWWHSDARRMLAKEPAWVEVAREIHGKKPTTYKETCIPRFSERLIICVPGGEGIVVPA